METVIMNLWCFLELWMIQLYAGLLWGERICFKGFSCILFVINGMIFTGISRGILPDLLFFVIYAFLFVYLWIHFKVRFRENIVKFCILFIISWITEALSSAIVYFTGVYLADGNWKYVIVNVISLGIAFLAVYISKKTKDVNMKVDYKLLLRTAIICIIPMGILVFIYERTHKLKLLDNIFIVAFCALLFWYFIKMQKAKAELERKELELYINKIYGDLYKNDISEIRKKQHDFKNQLAAIYSSHKTARSLNELIEIQKKYCDILQEESEYEYILTICEEPVLAGFLYYKCVYCQSKGVKVNADIHIEKWSCCVMLHELIEILGIFIDNALEQELENAFSDKEIYIIFTELGDRYYISTANRIQDAVKVKLTKLFELGYSTKGEKRGLGLARAKQICNRYGQEIKVLCEDEEERKIKFELEILK